MNDPARVVLSAVFTNDVSLIDEVSRSLTEAHFVDPTLRSLYRSALSYRSISQGVLTPLAVDNIVSGIDAGQAALIQELFAALAAEPRTPADARWAVSQLRANRERWLTQTALADASEILSGSVTDDKGRAWSGPADAREWAQDRIAEILSEVSVDDSPAGDVRAEAREFLREYRAAREEDRSRRPCFGLSSIDDVTGGLGPGELVVMAAPSGMGKSHSCVHLAYNAAVEQGLSVYFATSETVRSVVRTRLYAHHSRHPKFEDRRAELGIPYGMNSSLLRRGTLDASLHRFLAEVVDDFSRINGALWVAQVPHGQTIPVLASQVNARARSRPVDLVIVDYLFLMSGTRRYQQKREEVASIITDGKHFCVDAFGGRGVPLVTPWQFNRAAKEEMKRTGQFELDGLSETAEIVNTSDIVFGLGPDGARDGRFWNLKWGILKNRDGDVRVDGDEIGVRVDYATSFFTERMGADGDASEVWSTNGAGSSNDALSALFGV
jgi:replicative DNA helicase